MSEIAGAIIVAAGSGTRMAGADKLFTEVAGQPLLAHAIAPFQECASIERIVLVMASLNLKRGRDLVERYGFTKATALVKGGERRQITADVTDDAAMVEALGEPVRLFEGSRANIKVTTVEDLTLIEALTAAPIKQA